MSPDEPDVAVPTYLTNEEVGMALRAGDAADAVVEVLGAELGDRLRVEHHLNYLKLRTEAGKLEVRFADVAEVLGYPFGAGDLGAILSAYYGRPDLLDDRLELHADMRAGVFQVPGEAQA